MRNAHQVVDRNPFVKRVRAAGKKVYVQADARVWFKSVEEVVDSIQAAGISNIGFLAYERKQSPAARHHANRLNYV